jgi:hypothetical protein
VAVVVVEPSCEVSRELEVLTLIFSYRHVAGVVGQDVRSHENGVGEEAHSYGFIASTLVLELGHSVELAHRCRALKQPRETRVDGHVALDEDGDLLRIESSGNEPRSGLERTTTELGRINGLSDGVQVDDAVESVVVSLAIHPLSNGTEVVAEVEIA